MTIAVALTFDEGILLAADTKHTFPGAMKLESTKIFAATYANGERSAFAITADSVDWAVGALQRCEEALRIGSGQRTVEEMRNIVDRTLRAFYRGHVYAYPPPRPGFTLLFVLGTHDELQLYRNDHSVVRALVGYDCQGTGAYLAHSVLRDQYIAAREAGALQLPMVYNMTMQALKRTKEYDDGCGMSTEVLALFQDGRPTSVRRIKQDTAKAWQEGLKKLDKA
jgi:20S proteasome alpha/beta subunit